MKDKWYLAHPFDSRYRMRKIELELEYCFDLVLMNPFYDTVRTDIVEIDDGRISRYEKLISSDIVDHDVQLIRNCDAVLAVICDTRFIANTWWSKLIAKIWPQPLITYGTIMEIVYAYKLGKPIYMLVLNGHHNHPWLKYHATTIFTSLGDLKTALIERGLDS